MNDGLSTAARLHLTATLALLLSALVLPAQVARANGGIIRLAQERAGPYELTVMTSPSPIRVGSVDVSAMVERAGTGELVQEARVVVTAEPIGHAGTSGMFEATRERATNKLFYAADVQLPTDGRWRIGVQVSGRLGEGAVSFEVEASPPSLFDNPMLVLLLAVLPIGVILWWLSRARPRRMLMAGASRREPRGPVPRALE